MRCGVRCLAAAFVSTAGYNNAMHEKCIRQFQFDIAGACYISIIGQMTLISLFALHPNIDKFDPFKRYNMGLNSHTPCIIYTIFCPSPHVYIADMTADVPRNVRRELVRFRNVSINFAKLYLCSITTAAAWKQMNRHTPNRPNFSPHPPDNKLFILYFAIWL